MNKKIFKGNIIYSIDKDALSVHENSYIIVENGKVVKIATDINEEENINNIFDFGNKLIIPGFSDMHVHAPQYLQMGVGMDKELLDWLDTYTYPNEAKFKSKEHAKEVYTRFVNDLIKNGTLHVNCFPSIHYDASDILFKILEEKGLYAFTGKLNMDQNSPDFYIENTEQSISDTEKFILEHKDRKSNVTTSIVPRFAITCSEKLLNGLGELAVKYNTPVHSHMCEAVNEIKVCKKLFPNYENGAEIFNKNNLMGHTPTIMAHCIFMDDDVLKLMKNENCMAVHCPDATSNVNAGGIMPVKKLLDMGINLALGSDIGGGSVLSIAKTIKTTIQHSKIRNMYNPEYGAVNLSEAFYMATRSGGRYFDKVGAFDEGYHFNALIIDDSNMYTEGFTPEERLERFCYTGDDRNIVKRYINGEEITFE